MLIQYRLYLRSIYYQFCPYFYLTCPPTTTQLLALTSSTTKSTNTNNHYIHIHTIRLDLDTSTRLDADKWIFAMLQHLDQPWCIIGLFNKDVSDILLSDQFEPIVRSE